MLRIQLYREDDLDALLAPWAALCERAGDAASAFQCPAWCWAWLKAHGAARGYVAAAWDGNELLAVLPLVEERDLAGRPRLGWIGGRMTGAGTFVRAPDCDARAVLAACLSRVRTETHASAIALANLSDDAKLARTLGFDVVPAEAGYACARGLMPLTSAWDAFGRSARRTLRRSERRLLTEGDLGLAVLAPSDKRYRRAVTQLLAWKQVQLRRTGRSTRKIRDPRLVATLEGLGELQAAAPAARLYLLEQDGRPLAGQLGLLHAGHFSGLLMAFEPDHRGVSLGSLATCHVLEHLIADGAQTYDLLGYPEPYKEAIADLRTPLWDAVLPLAPFAATAWRAGRALRRRAKSVRNGLPMSGHRLLFD